MIEPYVAACIQPVIQMCESRQDIMKNLNRLLGAFGNEFGLAVGIQRGLPDLLHGRAGLVRRRLTVARGG